MELLSRKEIERLKKLELLRKLLQLIFFKHIKLLLGLFASLLLVIFVAIYFFVTQSPMRYTARISLYYYPKQTKNITCLDAKYVLQLLNRQTVRHRFYEETAENGSRIPCAISIFATKREKNHYHVLINSGSSKNAVNYVNTFADLCVNAYVEERTESLNNWKKVLQQKKQDVFKDITQVNLAKNRIGATLHAPAPEKDFEQLRVIMDEQQSAHTKLSLVIANLEHRQKQLQSSMAKINPALFDFGKQIREHLEAQKALDKEILLAKQLYTESNPKLMALGSRKKNSEAAFASFLKEKKIAPGDIDRLAEADTIKAELKTVSDELEARRGEMRVLNIEIANINNRFHRLNEILPHVQQLNQQHASLMESLHTIDSSIADINYLLPLVKDDLKIGVRATTATGDHPFRKKNLAIGFLSALMLTGFAATILLLFEYLFGKVADESELELFYEFRYLGALPKCEAVSEAEALGMFNPICHMFQSASPKHHIVLVGTLPGGRIPNSLFEAFEWNYAMAGKRMITLEMILATAFEDPGYVNDDMAIVTYSGSKGYLPVASKKLLAPTEVELIKRDLETLRKSYDLILIRHSASLRRDRLFLGQVAMLCDGAMVAVGAQKTRRRSLRALVTIHERLKIPVMTVLSESSVGVDKNNHGEAES